MAPSKVLFWTKFISSLPREDWRMAGKLLAAVAGGVPTEEITDPELPE